MLTKLPFSGRVAALLSSPDRALGLEKHRVDSLQLVFAGILGDCHSGLTARSDVRMIRRHKRGTEMKNARQLSIVSAEELADIAAAMGIPEMRPEWVGANLMTAGIPDLTLLPPSTRLLFPSNAAICIDLENAPCRQVSETVARYYPEQAMGFVKAATHRRGVVGWVEREGVIRAGDRIAIWIPPQRFYVHGSADVRQAAE